MRIVCLIYCASGFVSLAYQVGWFRILVDRFGSTNLTFGFVVCNFIGGLGAGSLASRPLTEWISRHARMTPRLRVYGAVEMLVAATAMLTLLLPHIPASMWGIFAYRLSGNVYCPAGVYQLSQLLITTLCVFIPCFFMGVTFPLLCSVFSADARFPSKLYGWNTLGACSGVLACEFFFLPLLGHGRTFLLTILINLALGLFFLFAGGIVQTASDVTSTTSAPAAASKPHGRRRKQVKPKRLTTVPTYPMSLALTCAVMSGLLTGALEADVLRRLQFLGCRSGASMSFVSFWAILAIFLASWTVRSFPHLQLRSIKAAFLLALVCYLFAWHFASPLRAWANATDRASVINALPRDSTGALAAFEFFYFKYGMRALLLFTGLFVFPAFYLVSLLFPNLCNALQATRRHLGIVAGVNTLAFCAGMFAFTWLAPRASVFYSFKLFMWFFAILVVLLITVPVAKSVAAWKPAAAALALVTACAAVPASFDAHSLPPSSPAAKYPVRAMKSNGAYTTFVVEDPMGDVLFFDSHSMSGTNSVAQQYMRLMAHFPLLLHSGPKQALLICFGVGSTASAIASHGSIQRIDIVELNDKVLETAPEFAATNRNVVRDPRVNLFHDDGRHFLDVSHRQYDLITSEPPPPMDHGVYRLYSRQYYESVLDHLAPGGMMTQWLPIGQMPRPAVELAVSTFVAVFPHSLLFVGHDRNYIMLGSNAPVDLANAEVRFPESGDVMRDLRAMSISRPIGVIARIIKGDRALRREFADFPVISDQHNDFSHLFHNPHEFALITYDPVALLGELRTERLQMHEVLRKTILHLGRLKMVVPDFPESALMSVRAEGAKEVRLADVDWYRIGRLFREALQAMHQGHSHKAISLAKLALRISAELPHMVKLLGTLQTDSGLYEAALHTWRKLQSLEPDNADGYHGAGWVLLRLHQYDDAIGQLNRAVQLNPRNPNSHKALGDALASVGRLSDAVSAYDMALSLDPTYEAAKRSKELAVKRMGGP